MIFAGKTNLLTHIFNEEYLLPHWLKHHKNMFDNIIIVDYNSTDNSIKICREICPDCIIIKTRNDCFGACEVDIEMMNIESAIYGIKIVLNTTEFLICECPIKDIFSGEQHPISYAIDSVSPYSINNYNLTDDDTIFSNLLNSDVVYHFDRGSRQLHNHDNGRYTTGRHGTFNTQHETNKAHIICFGNFPMNDKSMKRKLQIQQNIPQRDKDCGYGYHHLWSEDKIMSVINEKSMSGLPLKDIHPRLHSLFRDIANAHM
jgi:hypothetical protein